MLRPRTFAAAGDALSGTGGPKAGRPAASNTKFPDKHRISMISFWFISRPPRRVGGRAKTTWRESERQACFAACGPLSRDERAPRGGMAARTTWVWQATRPGTMRRNGATRPPSLTGGRRRPLVWCPLGVTDSVYLGRTCVYSRPLSANPGGFGEVGDSVWCGGTGQLSPCNYASRSLWATPS